jgi:D-sedoheptulose 7-phosphate isomerase
MGGTTMKDRILSIFEESARVKIAFARENAASVAAVVSAVADTLRSGNKIILFGNGGSATDASHIAAEFVNRFLLDRPPLPAIALNTDPAVLTSISNDFGYDQVFAKQLAALGRPGDIVFALSTSGNSPNVLLALNVARQNGMRTVVLTGGTGGKMANLADHTFIVPSRHTPHIQETHITLCHIICQLVDEELFGGKR